jgi:hypothetical protein
MSPRKEVLSQIAMTISSGGAFHIAKWFTEDFRLSEPTKPDWPVGYAGAQKLLEIFRTLTPPVTLEILDMVEESDKVAARLRLSAI